MKEQIHKKYKPVNCDIIDWVEHYATRREVVDVFYTDDNEIKKVNSLIKTWTIDQGIEYLILESDNGPIRMDHITQIGDIKTDLLHECKMD